MSVDPKASAWESPYVSMGNNPLMYFDALGDTIISAGFDPAESLTQDYIYLGANSQSAKELLQNLNTSSIYIEISDASRIWFPETFDVKNSETKGDNNWAHSLKGSNNVDLQYFGSENVQIDGITAYSYIVLVHELVHAKDISEGYFDDLIASGCLRYEMGSSCDGGLVFEIAEIRAMVFTNMVRKELGMDKIRTSYRGVELLKPDGVTPIRDYGIDILDGLFNNPINLSK
jgi:hypothetical protein